MRNYKNYFTIIAIFVIFMSGLLSNPQEVEGEGWVGAWTNHLLSNRLIVPIPQTKIGDNYNTRDTAS
jgi:hypothetical protein